MTITIPHQVVWAAIAAAAAAELYLVVPAIDMAIYCWRVCV